MQRGIFQAWQGRVDEALSTFAEGKARYTGIGGRSAVSTFEATVGLLTALAGRLEEGRAKVEAARLELETYGERWNEPIVLLAEGVCAAVGGDRAQATARLGRAVEVADAQGSHAVADRVRAMAGELGVDLGTRESPGHPLDARSPGLP